MSLELTTINPRKAECFGYEYFPGERFENDKASLELITTILFGIENRDKIPPVDMFHLLNPERYEIVYTWAPGCGSEGGHHRLLAYYFGGYLMPIRLFSKDDVSKGPPIPEDIRTHVKDMRVASDKERFERALTINEGTYRIPPILQKQFKTPNQRQIQELLEKVKQRPISTAEILRLYQ